MSDPELSNDSEALPKDRPAPRGGSGARLLAGRYRIGLRRGSAVDLASFEAVDTQLQRPVMVKLLHPSLEQDEALHRAIADGIRDASALRHPNLAHIFDSGTAEWNGHQVMFIIEESLTGGSLRDLLDRGRLLSPSQALLVGLDACRALDALHQNGLIHGDVRPSTLVFGDDRRLRLVDCGAAGPLAGRQFTDVGHVANDRAAYASPEAASRQPLVPQSDVYSLCLTLIELVTGAVPFSADSAVATLGNRVGRLMPVSADLGPMAPVFERAGRPDWASRSTAAEFGRALMQTAEKLPRPQPIQLLSGGLFADVVTAGQPVDPTGPMLRPAADAAEVAVAAEVVVAGDAAEFADAGDAAADKPSGSASVGTGAADRRLDPTQAISVTKFHDTPLTIVMADEPLASVAPTVAITQQQFDPVAPLHANPPVALDDRRAGAGSARPGLRRSVLIGIVLAILMVGGSISWWLTTPTIKAIPELVGLTEGEALNRVTPLGFRTATTREANDDVAAGTVIRTVPVAGVLMNVRLELQLVVSTGPAPRALPELVGLTLAQATAALDAAGLKIGQAEPVFDESVALGTVLRWSVPELPGSVAGDTVNKGTTVQVVLSAGPKPRPVPMLVGLTIEAATAALEELGLVVTMAPDEFSPDVGVGLIARQSPAQGESLARGASVTLVLSKGPELVKMPSLVGLTVDQARLTLSNAQLKFGLVIGDSLGTVSSAQRDGAVIPAGADVPKGATIDLVTVAPAATTTSTLG